MKKLLLGCAFCLIVTPAAFAGDWTVGWSGEASISGSKTTGNTDTTDIGAAIKLAKTDGPWRHKFYTTYDLGTASGVDNKNRWTIGYQLDRQISDHLYPLGTSNYFTDDFGSVKNGSYLGAGIGFEAIKTDAMKWDLEAGAGFRSQKTRGTVLVFPVREEEIAFRGSSNFTYQFNDAVSFFNNSEITRSDSDTYIWNDTGITAQVAGNLAARFNFRVDHHSTVPFGVEQTDTITRGALVYTLQ
jgi:putative salt-induced outer membrane protein